MLEKIWTDLLATSWLEVVAVVTGIIYIVLIVRRNRLGWIAGALSSAIYVWLAAQAHLPMQSGLQAYYVAMAVYGWFSWTRNQQIQSGRIFHWPWRRHVLAVAGIGVAGGLSARWLATETHAAWPLLDSLTTVASVLATWLVARSVLENWLYWMVADAIMIFLFTQQGHPFTAGLFAIFLVIAILGFRTWSRQYRAQTP